jgi:hypothetical protein
MDWRAFSVVGNKLNYCVLCWEPVAAAGDKHCKNCEVQPFSFTKCPSCGDQIVDKEIAEQYGVCKPCVEKTLKKGKRQGLKSDIFATKKSENAKGGRTRVPLCPTCHGFFPTGRVRPPPPQLEAMMVCPDNVWVLRIDHVELGFEGVFKSLDGAVNGIIKSMVENRVLNEEDHERIKELKERAYAQMNPTKNYHQIDLTEGVSYYINEWEVED